MDRVEFAQKYDSIVKEMYKLLKSDIETRNVYIYESGMYEDNLARLNIIVGMLDIVLPPKQILENFKTYLADRGFEIESQVKNKSTLFDTINEEFEILAGVEKYLEHKGIDYRTDEGSNNFYIKVEGVDVKLDNEALYAFYLKYLGMRIKEVKYLMDNFAEYGAR